MGAPDDKRSDEVEVGGLRELHKLLLQVGNNKEEFQDLYRRYVEGVDRVIKPGMIVISVTDMQVVNDQEEFEYVTESQRGVVQGVARGTITVRFSNGKTWALTATQIAHLYEPFGRNDPGEISKITF